MNIIRVEVMNIKRTAWTWIVLLFTTHVAWADDCVAQEMDISFYEADLVFIGRVLRVADTSFYVSVIEDFKGMRTDSLIGLITQESIRPAIGQIWLFYGEDLGNGNFHSHYCSGSKSFDRPSGMPVPPRSRASMSISELEIYYETAVDRARNKLYFEIMSLRSRKFDSLELKVNRIGSDVELLRERVWQLMLLVTICLFASTVLLILSFRKS